MKLAHPSIPALVPNELAIKECILANTKSRVVSNDGHLERSKSLSRGRYLVVGEEKGLVLLPIVVLSIDEVDLLLRLHLVESNEHQHPLAVRLLADPEAALEIRGKGQISNFNDPSGLPANSLLGLQKVKAGFSKADWLCARKATMLETTYSGDEISQRLSPSLFNKHAWYIGHGRLSGLGGRRRPCLSTVPAASSHCRAGSMVLVDQRNSNLESRGARTNPPPEEPTGIRVLPLCHRLDRDHTDKRAAAASHADALHDLGRWRRRRRGASMAASGP